MSELLETLRAALAPDYEVERRLGAGGMGSVFLARDTRLDRQVAVKVVSPELAANSAVRQRFLREARTIARLRHPSIVDVYTVGESNGLLYFIMQCVVGESLRELLEREQRLSPERAAEILRELADALSYAHAQAVIHRDIKPENVLIDEPTGRALLTDFGVARAFEATDDRMTGTGLIIGSPRYMSPEQAAGDRELDGRSDIYSLGLVGYEMLTGAPTFSGASPVSVIAKQITEVPPPVATRVDGVPAPLAHAIDRALAKDPSERWATAEEMAAALAPTADASRIGAPAHRRANRSRVVIAGAAAVLAIAAIGAWALRDGGPSVDPRKSFFVAPFEVQGNDPALDWLRTGSVNMLTLNLATWSDLTVVDYERTLDLLRDAELDDASRIGLDDARGMARRSGVWTVVLGLIQRVGDSLIVTARTYDVETGRNADEPVQHTVHEDADPRLVFDAIARELLDLAGAPPMRPELARTTTSSLEAYQAYLTGLEALNGWRLAEADSAFEHAIRADSTFALAYYKRALAQGWRRTITDTSDVRLARTAALHGTRLPVRERSLVESYHQLTQGLAAHTQGDPRTGSAHLMAAARGYEGILAKDSLDAEAWYGLADAYFHDGGVGGGDNPDLGWKWTRALRAFERTLALDSTFHLAYAHKLSIYQVGGSNGSRIVVEGDTVMLVTSDSAARALGADRIERARATARELALRDARHWRYLDPEASQAHLAVVDGYVAARRFDSAAAALRQTMELPEVRTPDMAYYLAALELAAGAPDALGDLRRATEQYGPDSLIAAGGTRRFQSLMSASNVAAFHGTLPDHARVLDYLERVEPRLPGANTPMRYITGMWRAMTQLALGMDSPAIRRTVDSSIAAIDRMPAGIAGNVQGQSRGLAYAAYFTTRDTAYIGPLRRWGSKRLPPEIDALMALEAGDTTRAEQLAAGFRHPDSLGVLSPSGAGLAQFVQAELMARLGDLRRAVSIYESFDREDIGVGGVDPRWPLFARSFLARAQLYEQLGDPQKAIAAYERFMELWREASPALQAQVRLAREGVARLKDARGEAVR
ncbi:MAG: protein kinase domain-containing protein [Gemmatimonadaceae bacterium]